MLELLKRVRIFGANIISLPLAYDTSDKQSIKKRILSIAVLWSTLLILSKCS